MFAAAREEILEFVNSTSLHGVKLMATRKTTVDRAIWGIVCGAAFIGTILMTNAIWTAFRNSPTQTIVQDPSFPVWNIDFPALTVCNLNKVQLSRAKDFYQTYPGAQNISEAVFLDSLLALGMMRYPYYHHPLIFVRQGRKRLIDFASQNITHIMLTMMAKNHEIFGTCYWKGREIPCDTAFRLQITEEGFCYSFNSKTSITPNPPDMDSPPFQDRSGRKLPWRNNAAGKTTGLEVFFRSVEEEYLPSDGRTPGYNLIVHHPDEFPDVSRGLFLPRSNGRTSMLSVTSTRVFASPSLSRLSLSERGCRLRGDPGASGALEEVQTNCWAQCRLEAIAKRCKCVPYFGTHRVSKDIPHCTINDISCLSAYNAQQRNIRPPPGSSGFRKYDLNFAIDCSCPPSCASTTYKTEFITTNRVDPFPFDDYAYLDVFFKDLEVVSYIRDLKFGVMDLIVSFGGMAGLFLGFSLITAVELAYFFIRGVARALGAAVEVVTAPSAQKKPNDNATAIKIHHHQQHQVTMSTRDGTHQFRRPHMSKGHQKVVAENNIARWAWEEQDNQARYQDFNRINLPYMP